MKITRFLAVALLLTLVAGSLSAYVLLSPRRTWDSPPNVIVDSRGNATIGDGSGGTTRIRNAIVSSSAWNGAGTGTRLTASVGSISGFTLGDGRPMLNLRDPIGACTSGCLAATFTGYYVTRPNGTRRITDADIVTNTANNLATLGETCSGSEYYAEGIMVHEVGHQLGIGHSGTSGATMYPSVSPCNNGPATIENDDRNAINDLY
jgi:hypothetical protein